VAGSLVICPTPIGNLSDVTLRLLSVLREADVIACEDTRVTRKLLERHTIKPKALISYHEHNERRAARQLLGRVERGELVALVSDAGTPGVSDPGRIVVDACLEAGLHVEVLPGPSSVVTALVASGLPDESWSFVGFLPRKRGELRGLLADIDRTTVAFESPRRVGASLATLAEIDAERPVAVCRELTKLHEEIMRGSAGELAERFSDGTRGEVVLVIGPAPGGATTGDLDQARAAVERLVEAGAKRRAAASVVGSLTDLPANKLYGI
jgi:16S rRNA (cytidine1402-2'-O)-methyltransferase